MALAEQTCHGFESESSRAQCLLDSKAERQSCGTGGLFLSQIKMSQREKWKASGFVLQLNDDISSCHTPTPKWHTHLLRSSSGAGGTAAPDWLCMQCFPTYLDRPLLQRETSEAAGLEKRERQKVGGREEAKGAGPLANTLLRKQTHPLFLRNILWLDSCSRSPCRDRQHPALPAFLLLICPGLPPSREAHCPEPGAAACPANGRANPSTPNLPPWSPLMRHGLFAPCACWQPGEEENNKATATERPP